MAATIIRAKAGNYRVKPWMSAMYLIFIWYFLASFILLYLLIYLFIFVLAVLTLNMPLAGAAVVHWSKLILPAGFSEQDAACSRSWPSCRPAAAVCVLEAGRFWIWWKIKNWRCWRLAWMDERGLRVEIQKDQLLCKAAEFLLLSLINFHIQIS